MAHIGVVNQSFDNGFSDFQKQPAFIIEDFFTQVKKLHAQLGKEYPALKEDKNYNLMSEFFIAIENLGGSTPIEVVKQFAKNAVRGKLLPPQEKHKKIDLHRVDISPKREDIVKMMKLYKVALETFTGTPHGDVKEKVIHGNAEISVKNITFGESKVKDFPEIKGKFLGKEFDVGNELKKSFGLRAIKLGFRLDRYEAAKTKANIPKAKTITQVNTIIFSDEDKKKLSSDELADIENLELSIKDKQALLKVEAEKLNQLKTLSDVVKDPQKGLPDKVHESLEKTKTDVEKYQQLNQDVEKTQKYRQTFLGRLTRPRGFMIKDTIPEKLREISEKKVNLSRIINEQTEKLKTAKTSLLEEIDSDRASLAKIKDNIAQKEKKMTKTPSKGGKPGHSGAILAKAGSVVNFFLRKRKPKKATTFQKNQASKKDASKSGPK